MNGQQAASSTIEHCTYFSYQQTGYFSKTILDYLDKKDTLQPFYQHEVSIEGIKAAIQQRRGFQQDRATLVNVLNAQYNGLPLSAAVSQNIQLLAEENTFTITTAHQPVIFTGPLYFAYKILHAVKLAGTLSKQLPEYKFVPVFYMGSEDADLDELGTINVDGKEYKWKTKQTGAVGRMKVDAAFLSLLQQLENQINGSPFGNEILQLFKQAYRLGATIQQATLEVVNELFCEYGVVVLIPDNANLKRLLTPVFTKELEQQFSHHQVEATLQQLSQHYKVQAGGRELNLFYLTDNSRERIEKAGDDFIVQNTNLCFTVAQMQEEVEQHPERFSPNVILRGVLQETVLPNLVFIGGGGELAYWLELKNVFREAAVPYPVLVLRNSFLFTTKTQEVKIESLGFTTEDLFRDFLSLLNELAKTNANHTLTIEKEIREATELFQHLQSITGEVDITLREHTVALQAQTIKKLEALQKKILRAERRKYEEEKTRIEKLQADLFPHKNLQERVENISGWYARYGKQFIQTIYQHSLSLEQQFTIVTL